MLENESITALNQNKSVPKDDYRIILRGKMDSLYGIITFAGAMALRMGYRELADDLSSLGQCCFQIISGGIQERDMDINELSIMGLDEQQLRNISHSPQQFSLKHFLPVAQDGEMMGMLNIVRTQIREAECCAISLLEGKGPGTVTFLNRMSSAAYIMMCRLKAQVYQKEKE